MKNRKSNCLVPVELLQPVSVYVSVCHRYCQKPIYNRAIAMLVIIFLFRFLCNSLLHLNFGRPLQVHANYCDTSVKMLAGHIKTYQNNINIGVGPSEEASADAPAQGFHLAYGYQLMVSMHRSSCRGDKEHWLISK